MLACNKTHLVVHTTLSHCNIIKFFSQNKPVELRVDATDQQNDVKLFLYNLARKYADRHFQWNELEQSLETEFNLKKNSLNGKLKELQGPLMLSKGAYEAAIKKERIADSNFDKLIKEFPVLKANKDQLKQLTTDFEVIMKQGEEVQKRLGDELRSIWGDSAIIPQIKERAEAWQKIVDKYHGKVELLRDVSRFSGDFGTFAKLRKAYESLLTIKGLTILNIKNKFLDPDVLGYADINTNASYTLPDGSIHICEIQLHLSSIRIVKEAVHVHYETIRTTIPRMVEDVTPEVSKKIQQFAIGRLRSSQVETALVTLAEKAGGVFLHARLLMEQMDAKSPGWKLDFNDLQALSSSVYSHYDETLKRIFPLKTSAVLRNKGTTFMSLICAAAEPLLSTSMEKIMGEEDFEMVKGKLSLLFPTDSGGYITITHKSVVDFLTGFGEEASNNKSDNRTCLISSDMMKAANVKLCQHCFEAVGLVRHDDSNDMTSSRNENNGDKNELASNVLLATNDGNEMKMIVYAWKHTTLHACNGGDADQLEIVRKYCLLDFKWQFEKLQRFGYMAVQSDLEEFKKLHPSDRAVVLIAHAFRLSLPAIIQNCLLLASQLAGGRLNMGHEKKKLPVIQRFEEDAEAWLVNGGKGVGSDAKDSKNSCWRPVTKSLVQAGNPCLMVFGGHEGDVLSVRLDARRGYAYSGSGDGTM